MPEIKIIKVDTLPTREEHTWSYPVDELDHIFEKVKDGEYEEVTPTFYLFQGRIYECFETTEGL